MKLSIFALFAALSAWVVALYTGSRGSTFFSLLEGRSSTVAATLGPKLSADAAIYLPGVSQFTNATDRWQEYRDPNISVVVEVATESDVAETILYANANNISFLAVNSGHGAIDSLGNVYNGIQIWLRKMDSITIGTDGTSATIGGGVLSKQVTDALWAANKQTVTGACECTGLGGPVLGGGHGFLQGRYGLLSDNLISARMVLANGTIVTVSADSNPDLFWAIQGAGHNFGIATSFEYKIYDVPTDDSWSWESFIYTEDKVEALYTAINNLTAYQPVELINYSFFFRLPAVDPTNPLIMFYILYQGDAAVEATYAEAFHALGPAIVDSGIATYPELAKVTGNDNDASPCQHGLTNMRFPISTMEYSPAAQREVFSMFSNLTATYSEMAGSLFLFEGYSTQGVKAVSPEVAAFPHRDDNLIISPLVRYSPDATLDAVAIKFGQDVRQVIHAASGATEVHAYVNYAHGDESVEEMYGFESWRQEKLTTLKAQYDPNCRFSFYAPIPVADDVCEA